ncbi:ComF family protein [Membranihabitans maritimus]|uniref:ComF family protein n=1 Tax=Membranihabitans maritimus TaxID=2904244 RepID=UPI001F397E12|nr:hypothetical protein [Membranihabitans maritimus]
MNFPGSIDASILLDVFFPKECLVCNDYLQYNKRELFCPLCKAKMVISDSHLTYHHPLKQRLHEWFQFKEVYSKYRFPNGSMVQKIIHHFKYHNLRYIGYEEAKEFGAVIKPELKRAGINFLVPIPLHWYKKFSRGFNQSLIIAQGLSQTTDTPVLKGFLQRRKYTRSQTKLDRISRLKNMENAFSVYPKKLTESGNLHFLLIDDVITSGITLGSAAKTIQGNSLFSNSQISAFSLAYKDYN